MIVNFLGDSITEGSCASAPYKTYVALFGKTMPAVVNNYGVGGTRIAAQNKPSADPRWDEPFYARALRMDKTADFVFVMGGTNDYGHGDAPIGRPEDTTRQTFYGGVNELLGYLVAAFGQEKLCFILPLHRYNEDLPSGGGLKSPSLPLSGYRKILREACDRHGVDCIDMGDRYPIPKVGTGDELTTDGLHPNDAGHAKIAAFLCDYLRTKMNT